MNGKHLLLDLKKCKNLPNQEEIYNLLSELPDKLGMKILTNPYVVRGSPHLPGWSGFVIIETSHISLHSFDDTNFISMDIYSCQDFNETDIIKYIEEIFEPKISAIKVIQR